MEERLQVWEGKVGYPFQEEVESEPDEKFDYDQNSYREVIKHIKDQTIQEEEVEWSYYTEDAQDSEYPDNE